MFRMHHDATINTIIKYMMPFSSVKTYNLFIKSLKKIQLEESVWPGPDRLLTNGPVNPCPPDSPARPGIPLDPDVPWQQGKSLYLQYYTSSSILYMETDYTIYKSNFLFCHSSSIMKWTWEQNSNIFLIIMSEILLINKT